MNWAPNELEALTVYCLLLVGLSQDRKSSYLVCEHLSLWVFVFILTVGAIQKLKVNQKLTDRGLSMSWMLQQDYLNCRLNAWDDECRQ